jgi:YjbE family integral membrane protein
MDFAFHPEFWLAVGQITMIDILLGGDNAVVIALACRQLPVKQRTLGIIWGTIGAIGLRVLLIYFALNLLSIPFLKLVGALLLIWIGAKLLLPEADSKHDRTPASERLWTAVYTVIIADFIMSLDNVVAIAAASENGGNEHKMFLVVFGLLVSIPIIVWGSQLVIGLMDRFPLIIIFGGMLLGWIAGAMAITDPAMLPFFTQQFGISAITPTMEYVAGGAGAILVWTSGQLLVRRRTSREKPGP